MKIYINGTFHTKEEAKISVYDHGLLYGDGVFEGIRVYNGRVFKLDEHLKRLYESANSIMLAMPMTFDELRHATVLTVRENNMRDAYIRLIITRGIGSLGLNPFSCEKPQVIIIVDKIALYPKEMYEHGMRIVTVPTQRNMAEAIPPQVKSLNYLNNILAKIEAINAGVEEAIMLNSYGLVAECTGDNIFVVKNNVIMTPPSYMGVLEGITRNTVMELAGQLSYTAKQRILTRHDLFSSDECFLTGSAAEIVPVTHVDGRTISDGTPGYVTKQLMIAFKKLTETTGTPVFAAA
ncbi:branched-chain-amino-acid transaminase [bacterium]|nr:branched-chain-amino-acid transaminase [bacterium]